MEASDILIEQASKAYYVGTHIYSFRTGEPAEILGVVWVTPEGNDRPPRACFHVRYEDGTEDFSAVTDTANYTIQGTPCTIAQ